MKVFIIALLLGIASADASPGGSMNMNATEFMEILVKKNQGLWDGYCNLAFRVADEKAKFLWGHLETEFETSVKEVLKLELVVPTYSEFHNRVLLNVTCERSKDNWTYVLNKGNDSLETLKLIVKNVTVVGVAKNDTSTTTSAPTPAAKETHSGTASKAEVKEEKPRKDTVSQPLENKIPVEDSKGQNQTAIAPAEKAVDSGDPTLYWVIPLVAIALIGMAVAGYFIHRRAKKMGHFESKPNGTTGKSLAAAGEACA